MRHTKHAAKRADLRKLYSSTITDFIDPYHYRCPCCNKIMQYVSGKEIFGEKNVGNTMYLYCPDCNFYGKTRKTNSGHVYLVSVPAGEETRNLRNEAHHYFNKLYEFGILPGKDSAYQWLSMQLGFPTIGNTSFRHIGEMDACLLRKVIEVTIDKLWENKDKCTTAFSIYTSTKGSYSMSRSDLHGKCCEIITSAQKRARKAAWQAKTKEGQEKDVISV